MPDRRGFLGALVALAAAPLAAKLLPEATPDWDSWADIGPVEEIWRQDSLIGSCHYMGKLIPFDRKHTMISVDWLTQSHGTGRGVSVRRRRKGRRR